MARTGATRPLSGSRRFVAVRAWRAHASSGVVRVAAAPNPVDAVRVGFAISGVKRAVDRNRLRRRLREAVRPAVASHSGLDFVVSAGTAAVEAPYQTLAADVAAAVATVAATVRRRTTQVR